MAGTYLGKYDTTAASNTATGTSSVSVAEGMLPSNINNAFRDIMADIRQHYNTAEWIEYGDGAGTYTPTYASSTSFTIDGVNVTSIYHANRRVKVTASTPGTIYGTISSTSFSTNTTVNVTWDSGSLSSEAITSVFIGALAKTNSSIPTGIIGTTNIAADAVTAAKMADNAIDSDSYVDGSIDLAHMSVNSIDSDQYVDASIDTAHIADANVTLAKLASSSVNSAKIVDDSIVNADINSSAAIDATKIADGTVTTAEFQYINTLSSNAQTQIDAKAATTYVDNAVAGLRTRIIAECASTANVVISSALEAGDTIDGITLVSGDRVLLKNQSTASENGLYTAVGSGAGAASRDTQFNSIAELSGQMVVVNQGSANDNKIFLCTTDTDASLGSDSITFTVITPNNTGTVTSIVAGTGLSGGTITSSGTLAIDTATTVDKTTAQTLTNKTLTTPVLSATSSNAGSILFKEDTDNGTNSVTLTGPAATADITVTLPATADTLVGKATTDTLTNKTFDLGGTGNSLTGSLSEFNTALQSESFTSLTGTETLTNKTLTAPKIVDGGFIADANGNEALVFQTTGSAVNELEITNNAAGSNPILAATGGDTNIGIALTPKGTGEIVIASGNLNYAGTAVTATGAELNKLASAGTLKQAGKETIWIPSNAMTPATTNGAERATVETTATRPDMQVLDFDKDADQYAQFAVAFPNSWNLGTVTFQAFWSGIAATTDVDWGLQAVAMNDNETIDVAFGTAVVVTDNAQGAVEELLVSAESGAITIAGTPADNDLTYFQIYRDVSGDAMAGDARLHGVKIFYTTNAANDA